MRLRSFLLRMHRARAGGIARGETAARRRAARALQHRRRRKENGGGRLQDHRAGTGATTDAAPTNHTTATAHHRCHRHAAAAAAAAVAASLFLLLPHLHQRRVTTHLHPRVPVQALNWDELGMPSSMRQLNGKPVLIRRSAELYVGANYIEVDVFVDRFGYIAQARPASPKPSPTRTTPYSDDPRT